MAAAWAFLALALLAAVAPAAVARALPAAVASLAVAPSAVAWALPEGAAYFLPTAASVAAEAHRVRLEPRRPAVDPSAVAEERLMESAADHPARVQHLMRAHPCPSPWSVVLLWAAAAASVAQR